MSFTIRRQWVTWPKETIFEHHDYETILLDEIEQRQQRRTTHFHSLTFSEERVHLKPQKLMDDFALISSTGMKNTQDNDAVVQSLCCQTVWLCFIAIFSCLLPPWALAKTPEKIRALRDSFKETLLFYRFEFQTSWCWINRTLFFAQRNSPIKWMVHNSVMLLLYQG